MQVREKSCGIVGFFKSHPILILLLLSPGIPEYLSGSSALNNIILNPSTFAIGLIANLGLYGPGVLLVREAKVRWQKGWTTVLVLGVAYGLLEEGIALSTLFNPTANPVNKLGFYGHWLGVNWIWAIEIVSFHSLYSISLPIMLLGLALPEIKEQSLLKSSKSIKITFTILCIDVFILFLFIRFAGHFWMGTTVLLSSLGTIFILVFAARNVPVNVLTPRSLLPSVRPFLMGIIGAIFYPAVLVTQSLASKLPPVVDALLVVMVQIFFLGLILRTIGKTDNERNLIAFSAGLIIPIALFGIVSEIKLPLSLLAVFIAVYLLWRLWRKYPKASERSEAFQDHLLQ